jgi:hypothetical protein
MALEYKPRERNTLQNLLAGVQGGLDPAFALGTYQETQQSALDRMLAQRQKAQLATQARQDMFSGLGSQLTEAAIGGVPPAGLEALVGLQSAANPMLAKPGVQSRLDELVGSAGTLSNSIPGAAGEPTALADELSVIDATVPANIQAEMQDPESRSGFYDTLALLRSRWAAMGLDQTSIRSLRDYFAQSWTSQGGTIPAAPGQQPAEAAGGDGGGFTIPGWAAQGIHSGLDTLNWLI